MPEGDKPLDLHLREFSGQVRPTLRPAVKAALLRQPVDLVIPGMWEDWLPFSLVSTVMRPAASYPMLRVRPPSVTLTGRPRYHIDGAAFTVR